MTDVFISYKREDMPAVQRLVEALRRAGLSVWWDQDIPPQAPWVATITAQLEAAKAVIVCWSARSVSPETGENVQAEAQAAVAARKLLQVLIEPVAPPMFMGRRQAVDLIHWDGTGTDAKFQMLAQAARDLIAGRAPAAFPQPPPAQPAPPLRGKTPWAVLTALFVGVSAALGFIANLGGARDAACSLPALAGACARLGLVATAESPAPAPAPDPAQILAAERARLLAGLNGVWARGDVDPVTGRPRDCSLALTIAVVTDPAGVSRVHVTAPGFDSRDQVETAADGVVRVSGRTAAGALVESKYEPKGDQLTYTTGGTPTTLYRCPAGGAEPPR